MMPSFKLTLVRHGETEHNKHRVLQGQRDTPLSSVGMEQAGKLSQHFLREHLSHAFSSDLQRAAKCFGEMEGMQQWQLQKAAHKAKQSLPDFTPTGGETIFQVEQRAAEFFGELCSNLFQTPQETKNETTGRKYCARQNTDENDKHTTKQSCHHFDQDHVLLVAHGGLIRTMINQFEAKFDCDLKPFRKGGRLQSCPNTGFSMFIVSKSGDDKSEKVMVSCHTLYNTDHLQDKGTSKID
ncbi:fructose-2,6-bisphosphatase TIGAR-like isoform X2 [Corticium candelabrum]|uniref:fructose-2,6-bisphosphatase TIGAR-like isoform X2 n=1 Tax=Corticium candelabrum TaxID=121492 RepID=UPI002E2553B0|nr:fructose-2,6-bisphosphatase TIGAR-like isoform X2 [Corticium candelabrum]